MAEEKLQIAKNYKEQGNLHFKQQEYKKALSNYHRVFLYINGIIDKNHDLAQFSNSNELVSEPLMHEIQELKWLTHGNMAQVYICLKNFEKGRQSAKKNLEIKESAKGLYRLAVCELELNYLDEALDNFHKARQLDASIDIDQKLQEIIKKQKKADQAMAKSLKKLFV